MGIKDAIDRQIQARLSPAIESQMKPLFINQQVAMEENKVALTKAIETMMEEFEKFVDRLEVCEHRLGIQSVKKLD